jgi:GDP-6-deoxy-D-talose 4-dehydrogenase
LRILVTGADGFTGIYFTKAAQLNLHQVFALKANINNVEALNDEVTAVNPDAVVHLAAISFVGHKNDEDFYKVNVVGTDNLLKAIDALNTKPRVLIASSANVYGNSIVEVIDESTIPAPVNHYATSKLAMEYIVKTWFNNLPIIITRPFNYTGVGQHENFLIPKIVSHFKRREKVMELGNLNVSRDFSDVRDIAAAYVKLIESNVRSQIVNICSGKVTSLKEIIKQMNTIAGYEIKVVVNPDFVRENEVIKLSANNLFLSSLINYDNPYCIEQTLSWMFKDTL